MLFEVWGLWAEETSAGLHVTPDSWTGQTHELHKELNPEPYIQRGNGAVKCSYAGRVGHRVNEVIVEAFPFSSTTPLPFPCLGPDHLNTTDRGGGYPKNNQREDLSRHESACWRSRFEFEGWVWEIKSVQMLKVPPRRKYWIVERPGCTQAGRWLLFPPC